MPTRRNASVDPKILFSGVNDKKQEKQWNKHQISIFHRTGHKWSCARQTQDCCITNPLHGLQ